ncbi:MAG TPA: universal stress protein [Pseudolabrys sp.]|nr:universal stress protein [Pseudolabrys sp.]
MPHIVAATDFSTRSQRALRRAGLLATQIGADLTLMSVVEDDQPQGIIDIERGEAEKFLKEQIASLDELRGVSCRALTVTGEAFDGILKVAQEVSCDLIVMGSHRKQVLLDVFVGTTIERVIRTGAYPVLMVNTAAEKPYERVVAAVDLSPASARAVKAAQALHVLDNVDVTLLHAFQAADQNKMNLADASRIEIDAYVDDVRERASAELAEFRDEHGLTYPAWQSRLVEGGAYESIARMASRERPDLVIIGTRGRSVLVKALLGSVAEEVLRGLDVDILAVPPAR